VPINTKLEMGQVVVKTWAVVNRGREQWPEQVKLIFIRGDRELLGETEEFSVERARAGQEVEISVPITTPLKSGRYTALFQLADADRKVFGARFALDIQVTGDEEDEKKKSPVVAAVPVPATAAVAPVAQAKVYPPAVDTSGWVDVKVDTSSNNNSPTTTLSKPLTVAPPASAAAAAPAPAAAPAKAPETPKPTPAAAPVKPVTVAPAAAPAKPVKWEAQLASLASMGFKNTELNSFLLEKHNGDLQRVTNWLIENISQQ
jgi:hypothetical protein